MAYNYHSTIRQDDLSNSWKSNKRQKNSSNDPISTSFYSLKSENVVENHHNSDDVNSDTENVTIDHEHGTQIVAESKFSPFYQSKSAFQPIKTIKPEKRPNNKRNRYNNVNNISQVNLYANSTSTLTNSNNSESKHPNLFKKTTCNPLHLLTVGIHEFHQHILRKSKTNEDDFLEVDIDSDDDSGTNVEREFSSTWSSMLKKMQTNELPIIHHRFRLEKLIGEGTFSHIVACSDVFYDQLDDIPNDKHKKVAIKLMKPKFNAIGQSEARILEQLSQKDGYLESNTIQFLSWFNYKNHFCLVLEKLECNLLNLRYHNQIKFTLDNIRDMAFQLLNCLSFLETNGIIHGDLKPENILLEHPVLTSKGFLQVSPKIKLADFGNAMDHEQTRYYLDSYELQSMSYRAPEIVMGLSIGNSIDMWSLGCVLVEMLLGLETPLFHCDSNSHLLFIMYETLGPLPRHTFKAAKFYPKFFSKDGDLRIRYETRTSNVCETIRERTRNLVFIDLIMRMLEYDPSKRLTASAAMSHPFFKLLLPRGTPTLELTVGKTLYGNLVQQYNFKLVEKTDLRPSWLYQKQPLEEDFQDSQDDIDIV